MQRVQKFVATAMMALGLMAPAFLPIVVHAESGSGGSGSGSGGSSTGTVKPVKTETTPHTESSTEVEDSIKTTTPGARAVKTELEARKNDLTKKLDAAKLKTCQERVTEINNRMANIVTRAQKQITTFDSITTKVEAFYKAKGNTLSNYDALVKAVTDAKATAEADLTALQAAKVEFKCDGTDPKGVADVFKTALKTEIADLKAYRTAVKNLIVGVKSVQPDDSTEKKTETTPSTTDTTTNKTTTSGGAN